MTLLLVPVSWLLDARCWILDGRYQMFDTECDFIMPKPCAAAGGCGNSTKEKRENKTSVQQQEGGHTGAKGVHQESSFMS